MRWSWCAALVLTVTIALGAMAATSPREDDYRALERVEIHELFDRYAWAIDYGDSDAFVKLFADDGYVVGGVGGRRIEGKEALKAWADQLWKMTLALDPPNRIMHIISNVKIDFTGPDTAHVDVMWTEIWRTDPYAGSRGIFGVRQAGAYHDEVVKRNGRWLFERHELDMSFPLPACVEGPPNVVPQPPWCRPAAKAR